MNWYSHCPHSSPTLAKYNHDCTDDGTQEFLATPTPKNFNFNKMRFNSATKKFDACIYKIGIPNHRYHTGNLFLRFNTMKNVNINVNYGESVFDASKSIVDNNGTVSLYEMYNIKMDEGSFILTTLPVENADDVQISF